eukprot:Skav210606  [mRNA]  locus=scaffold234:103928:104791:+ [translate_table: standard]
MSDYTFRIYHLSGELLAELSLPGTATVNDILCNLPEPPRTDTHVRRKIMHQSRLLEEFDVLNSLNFPNPPEIVELQVLQHSPKVQMLRGAAGSAEGKKIHAALFGPPQGGKSSILRRCYEDTFDTSYVNPIIGINFKRLRMLVDDVPLEVFLWDEPTGKERFRSYRQSYFRGKMVVILVIDLTSDDPFWQVDKLIRMVQDEEAVLTKILLANKLDLESERRVSQEHAKHFATEHGFHYFEVSAKDGTNVEEALGFAVVDALQQLEASHTQPPVVVPPMKQKGPCVIQ